MIECEREAISARLQLLRFAQRRDLDQALAAAIAYMLREAIAVRGRASVAFSGGSTPAPMLKCLSEQTLDWKHVNATLVDERWVELDHEESNEAQLRQSLQHNSAGAVNICGLKTEHAVAAAALATVDSRLDAMAWPLDCVHLGMGSDGHTASWFCDAPEYAEAINPANPRRVMATNPASAPHARITLTASAIGDSRSIVLHITGEQKLHVLQQAIKGDNHYPISIALNSRAPVTVYWAP